jgi:hypothetical protein
MEPLSAMDNDAVFAFALILGIPAIVGVVWGWPGFLISVFVIGLVIFLSKKPKRKNRYLP